MFEKQTKLQIKSFASLLVFLGLSLYDPMWGILMVISLIVFIWSLKTDYYEKQWERTRTDR